MYPQSYEIDEVGNAFITVSTPQYTPDQQVFLNRFLSDFAQGYNEAEVKKIFNDKIQVMDALKILHSFAVHYQNESEVFQEFKEEIEDLLINLNQKEEGIFI